MTIADLVRIQRQALNSERAATVREPEDAYKKRLEKLKKLYSLIQRHEGQILDALHADLGKSPAEGYITEVGFVLSEISYAIKRLRRWMRSRIVLPSLTTFPAIGRIQPEPYGMVLIISPWNYPFQLTFGPLVSAIAAGNRCILKPSNRSPNTASVMADLVRAWGDEAELALVTGGRDENQQLLDQRFDYIFFTGGETVGRLVMEKAAKHLTPVTLELGGKSPCIVDETADIPLAARRIAFGKGLNAGQTCVAPDFVLVRRDIQDRLTLALQEQFSLFYGEDPLRNDSWPKIISEKHFDRLEGLIKAEGQSAYMDSGSRRIAPTIVANASWDGPLMQEEIFGPLLPIIPYDDFDEMLIKLQSMEKPLALYLFSRDKECVRKTMDHLSFGGGCVNDTVIHLSHPRLPFGGVGNSGMGSYHGKHGFRCFSHMKPVLKRAPLDIPFRFPPFDEKRLRLFRRFMK